MEDDARKINNDDQNQIKNGRQELNLSSKVNNFVILLCSLSLVTRFYSIVAFDFFSIFSYVITFCVTHS